jgi:hypothetical protein
VLFLVGGLGSSRFLAEYITKKIGSPNFIVKQLDDWYSPRKVPSDLKFPSWSAVMRGAILHYLGPEAGSYVLPRHYGILIYDPLRSISELKSIIGKVSKSRLDSPDS